jgi:hypothetical protein
VMTERGLIDEAVEQIHEAGLGLVLKQLAEKVRATKTDTAKNEVTP